MSETLVFHPFSPVFDNRSRILILGSFPSVKSREQLFFYGHPQNRFWEVTSAVFGVSTPVSISEKKEFLLSHGIALWDVIACCTISGSSDSSIKNAVPNDLTVILNRADIKKIFTNGKTAYNLYLKHIKPAVGITAAYLPSTSPANAAFSLERLIKEWAVIAK